jgi:hypothetical protein
MRPAPYAVRFSFMSRSLERSVEWPGLKVQSLAVGSEQPPIADLALQVRDASETLSCTLRSRAGLFSAGQVRRFAADFQCLAARVTKLAPSHCASGSAATLHR